MFNMSFFTPLKIRLFGFYLFLIIFACLPIWSFEFYINQDGSPHLYNAYIILQLLQDNASFSQIYSLNQVPIPNLSGHWLLMFLLTVFSPFIVTKIFVTFCFAAFVSAIGWLRWQTVGREGMMTAFLLGAASRSSKFFKTHSRPFFDNFSRNSSLFFKVKIALAKASPSPASIKIPVSRFFTASGIA